MSRFYAKFNYIFNKYMEALHSVIEEGMAPMKIVCFRNISSFYFEAVN